MNPNGGAHVVLEIVLRYDATSGEFAIQKPEGNEPMVVWMLAKASHVVMARTGSVATGGLVVPAGPRLA